MDINCCSLQSKGGVHSIDFHPSLNILASATVLGGVSVFEFEGFSCDLSEWWCSCDIHTKSVRQVKFSPGGNGVFSGSSDGTVAFSNLVTGICTWRGSGHSDAINALCCIDENIVVTGDDGGQMRIWDIRSKNIHSNSKISEFCDSISGIILGIDGSAELLAICGDQVGCFDLRKTELSLKAMSDNIEDEMLCLSIVKDGTKLVCGTQSGSLCFFSYGLWGDINDSIIVNTETVNSLIKFDEDMVCTAGDDGEIHVINIHPNRILGKLEKHKRLSKKKIRLTDSLTVNSEKSILAFVGDLDQIYLTDTAEVLSLLERAKNSEDDFFDNI